MKDIASIASEGILLDGRYKLLRPLSSDGGTADVWVALDTNTIDEIYDETSDDVTAEEESGIKVAIKIYRPKNALDIGDQRFREEFKIVFNCHHTNLLQPINFSIYEGIPYLVLPYCQKGSSERLQGQLKDVGDIWKYISDVSAGLAYLHAFDPPIVHHDIKPANILIDDSGNYAITDFGISSHRGLNRDGYDDSQSGTMAYMAPERFKNDYESTPESDIWSLGTTLYELLQGNVPFGENGGLAQLEGDTYEPLDSNVPSDIRKLINDCLSIDVSKRPSASDICKSCKQRSYPYRNKKRTYVYLFAFCVLMGGLVMFLLPSREESSKAVNNQMANEIRFKSAVELIASPEIQNLKQGLSILDSLGSIGYVPALYEQAYTYGWYNDSTSIARKNLLGIDYYPADTDEQFLPKSQMINTKAIGLFCKIEELKDSNYPQINANALYRLACYYVNPNKVFKIDEDRAKNLLIQAKAWAEEARDEEILRKINNGLTQFN